MDTDAEFLTNPENFRIQSTNKNFLFGSSSGGGSSSGKYLRDGEYSNYLSSKKPDLLQSVTFNLGILAAFLLIVCGFLYYRYRQKKKRIRYQNYLFKSGKFFKYVSKMNDVNKRIKKFKKREIIKDSLNRTSNLLPSNSDDMDGFLFF